MSQKENSEVTAYSIYNVEQKKRTKINPLEDIYPKLPEKNTKLFTQIHLGIMVERCSMISQQSKMRMLDLKRKFFLVQHLLNILL